jgi:hypothetical protein
MVGSVGIARAKRQVLDSLLDLYFSLLRSVHTGSGTHPVYRMGTWGAHFSGAKVTGS